MVVKGGYFKYHVITGGYFLTATIDAYERLDIIVMDVTDTFIETNMKPNKDSE